MTAPTGTFLTTAAIGNREDLTDTIYRISPTATPFISLAAKGKASNTLHEWQTQDLASAVTTNAQAEGDDATAKTVTPTVRLNNRTQISTKTGPKAANRWHANTVGTRTGPAKPADRPTPAIRTATSRPERVLKWLTTWVACWILSNPQWGWDCCRQLLVVWLERGAAMAR
jgi:hypothetical protein